jgi:SAM-dependent methyltransferase
MPAYLVSGPAGSGKSLISQLLANRGYYTVDADADHCLSGYYDRHSGKKVTRETINPATWHEQHLWMWDKARMRQLFEENRHRVAFFCGTAHNESEFYSWFDSRLALFSDNQTLTKRLQKREPDVWPDGSFRLNTLVAWNSEHHEHCRRAGMQPIDATQSPERIVDDVLAAIGNPPPYYPTIKSFVDNEIHVCPRPLDATHISRDCVVLQDRNELLRRLPKRMKIAEIGTGAGKFAKQILATSDPRELHLFDLSFALEGLSFDHEFFASYRAQGVVSLHEGDSSYMLSLFADQYFDCIYIDADHSVQGMRRDISQAKRKIRRGGVLLFHDYTIYSPLEKISYGVPLAVNDLLIEDNFEMIYFVLNGLGYHDVGVRRRQLL